MTKEKKTPELRFPGFTDDWEQRKLGDIADVTKLAGFEFTEHVVYSDEGSIIALRGLNIKNGQLVLDDVKYIDSSNFSKLKRSKLYVNDIMFTYVGTVGEVAIIKENDRFYLAPNVSRIRVQNDDSPKFISHYMRTENFYTHVINPLIATSSQPALSMENIRKFNISLPKNHHEQERIAEFFDGVDNLITLHQQKLDKLKERKKGLLQKMFPKEGEKVPEIRFPGFTDDWEQRKLEDIARTTIGEFVIKTKQNPNSPYPVYNGGTSYTGFYDDYNNEGNKILISARGANAGYVNIIKTRYWAGNSCYSVDLLDKDIYDTDFIYQEMKRNQSRFTDNQQAANIPSVSKADVENFVIDIPSHEEQCKISLFLLNIDHLITLQEHKLKKLKERKKGLLQKMFV